MAPLPPLAAGAVKSVMAALVMNAFSETVPEPNVGAASDSTVTVNVRSSSSVEPVIESRSDAVTVTVTATAAAVGVPQNSRGSAPGHTALPTPSRSAPVASNFSHDGRLDAAYRSVPLPPVAAGAVNCAIAEPAAYVLFAMEPEPKSGALSAATL